MRIFYLSITAIFVTASSIFLFINPLHLWWLIPAVTNAIAFKVWWRD